MKESLRGRLPWFAVWVPVALLLYLLVNGGAFIAVIGGHSDWSVPIVEARGILCGAWGLLFWPVLGVFAYTSWKLSPQWTEQRLWTWWRLGSLLLFLLLAVQWIFMGVFGGTPFRVGGWTFLLPLPGSFPPGRMEAVLYGCWKPHGAATPEILLDSPDPEFRVVGLLSLAESGKADAYILSMVRDPDPTVRAHSVLALAETGARAVTPEMLAIFRAEKGTNNELILLRAFGKIGDPSVIPVVREALQGPASSVRCAAIQALVALKDRGIRSDLVGMLRDANPRMRMVVANALADVGDSLAIPALAGLLSDPDRSVRGFAAVALGKLGHFQECSEEGAQRWWREHKDDPGFRGSTAP